MIITAGELWSRWVDLGVLRPNDYDNDIVNLVRNALGSSQTNNVSLLGALDGAGWTARDLLRTIQPILASFSGMLTDLLRLYERIGATRADSDNLRIKYKFETGDRIDDVLAPFREHVKQVERVIAQMDSFQFPSFPVLTVWNSPVSKLIPWDPDEASALLGLNSFEELREWPYSSDFSSPQTDDPDLRRVLACCSD